MDNPPRPSPKSPSKQEQKDAGHHQVGSCQSFSAMKVTSGPLPDAQSFALYEKTTPGAGDRILAMAEEEQAHRHKLEDALAQTRIDDIHKTHEEKKQSLRYAFWVAVSIIISGLILACMGSPVAGALLSGSTIVGAIYAFINSNNSKHVTKLPDRKR